MIDKNQGREARGMPSRRAAHWFLWLIGVALLVTVVIAAVRFSEAREFVRLVEKSQPWWIVLAVVFQAGTYLAQGEVFRCVGRAGRFPLRIPTVYRLSLMKLFVDQALPSGGLSGTFAVANALERRGMPRTIVAAAIVIDLVSYYAAYVLSLAVALILAALHGEASKLILMIAFVFGFYGSAVSAAILVLSGRAAPPSLLRVAHFRPLRNTLEFLADADPHLARNVQILLQAGMYQLAIFLLDAATVWILIKSLGVSSSTGGVFTSFMISTLFRSVGILPGGLGSFEAASILTLRMTGVPIAVALSATLLFRGLSFWIPMLPGFWFSRRAMAQRHNVAGTPSRQHAGPSRANSFGIVESTNLENTSQFGSDEEKCRSVSFSTGAGQSRPTKPPTRTVSPAGLPFWSCPQDALSNQLQCGPNGLSVSEAKARLEHYGTDSLKPGKRTGWMTLLLAQFKTPIILILLFAAGLSFFLRDATDACIILVIVGISGLLGFWQEKSAADAVASLLALVQVKVMVLRDDNLVEVPIEQIMPGDVVVLNAGDVVPGDGRILESRHLFVDEATLTGETFPVEKLAGLIAADVPPSRRTNSLFLGTHVVSGTAKLFVVQTGKQTEFGKISEKLKLRPTETEFEHGVRRFGYFLLEVTLLLVIGIFAFNVYLARPVLDSLLFALALAVGLTPQLLPAIISVNLAHGARRMAEQKVIVKRLASIENFGSMTVLCCDKTGTLTEGQVKLESAVDISGNETPKALAYAALNASFQTGYTNPMDPAILARHAVDRAAWQKLDEEPYDFARRRMSVLISRDDLRIIVTKGALPNVLAVCSRAEASDGRTVDVSAARASIDQQLHAFSRRGLRVLGVAYRLLPSATGITKEHEAEMIFLGILSFSDPLRSDITQTLGDLRSAGVTLKIITGDHHLVALDMSRQAGFVQPRWLTGPNLRTMSNEALLRRVNEVDVFAEVEPNQKERLILALRKSGQVVGYMGDGINDASALHAADVGISVAGAADVAKEAADIVLLEKDLAVLARGVREGRVTFANTLKYVFMATSANFGNMFSMAGASLFLPFLPLLPKQILSLNLLTDLPEMTIATDRVDEEWTCQPRRWNLKFIRRFMITFGLLSSVFDYATFAVLLFALGLNADEFRSGWFVESVISASLIVLVVRTPRPLLRSIPSRPLLLATMLVATVALTLPITPVAPMLGLVPLPLWTLAILLLIVACYVVAAEWTKRVFYQHIVVS
ncbi:MAG: magnesium-translocating P-type ATPase [Verrucomicrobia bacterium]|nr:magnesium-translocating P-type ATPase [Verrucomicrobiota bacterium]